MKVTRRSLARSLAKTLAVATAAPAAGFSQDVPSGDPDLKSARDQMRANAEQIAKIKVPMATEPAFHFKA